MIFIARAINLLNRVFWRLMLGKVGTNFKIGHYSEIYNPHCCHIGDNFFAGQYTYISTNHFNTIHIGHDVMLGPFCRIIGGNHDPSFDLSHMRHNSSPAPVSKPIQIENGAWLGSGVTVLSGAYIGEGAIIGAASVVNNYIPPYTIAAGIPCRPRKLRFTTKRTLENMLNNVNSKWSADDLIEVYQSEGLWPHAKNHPN